MWEWLGLLADRPNLIVRSIVLVSVHILVMQLHNLRFVSVYSYYLCRIGCEMARANVRQL